MQPKPHSNTQTNSQGSALSPITSQLTPNNQAPSHNTQNTYPQRSTHPGADRASHPATHRNKAKTHRNKAQHPAIQKQLSTINFQKNQMQLSNNKKRTSNRMPQGTPHRRPLNSTNHRQGKNTSQ
jgi:hypothetical protein